MELSCMHLPSGASTRGTGTRGHPRDQQALEEWSQCRLISTSPPFQVSFSPPTLHFSAAFFPEPIKWLHLFREGQRCIPRRSGLFWTGFKTGKRQCRTGAGDHQPRQLGRTVGPYIMSLVKPVPALSLELPSKTTPEPIR